MELNLLDMKQAHSISTSIIFIVALSFLGLSGCTQKELHTEAVQSLITAVNQHDPDMIAQLVPSTSRVSDSVQCVIDNAKSITLVNIKSSKFPEMISRVLQDHERYYKVVVRATLRTNPNCGSGQHIWFILVAQNSDESLTITSIYKQP